MKYTSFLFIFFIVVMVWQPGQGVADVLDPDWCAGLTALIDADKLEQGITEALQAGVPAADVIVCAMNGNGDAYLVVKTALLAGADLNDVTPAALGKKVSSAVISRAAIDAGLEPSLIAGVLMANGEKFDPGEVPIAAYIPPLPTVDSGNLVIGVLVGSGGLGDADVSPSIP